MVEQLDVLTYQLSTPSLRLGTMVLHPQDVAFVVAYSSYRS